MSENELFEEKNDIQGVFDEMIVNKITSVVASDEDVKSILGRIDSASDRIDSLKSELDYHMDLKKIENNGKKVLDYTSNLDAFFSSIDDVEEFSDEMSGLNRSINDLTGVAKTHEEHLQELKEIIDELSDCISDARGDLKKICQFSGILDDLNNRLVDIEELIREGNRKSDSLEKTLIDVREQQVNNQQAIVTNEDQIMTSYKAIDKHQKLFFVVFGFMFVVNFILVGIMMFS